MSTVSKPVVSNSTMKWKNKSGFLEENLLESSDGFTIFSINLVWLLVFIGRYGLK